ncbi:MAG TPA: hypothetical protein VN845_09135 [Solirubrobacteraceae bacterium]|nr:hypothetical protein [Solirubrobacteraceae bacterium]
MGLWGLLAAVLATLVLLTITPRVWPTTDGRGAALREALTMLEHGEPMLVGRYHGASGAYYELKRGDDQGMYVYLPLASRILDIRDPLVAYRYMYIVLLALTVAVYPLVFYLLSDSLPAGVAAPIVFVACMISMGFLDLYWVPAWGVLTLLPLLFLLAQRWPRFGLLGLLGICLGASVLSTIRSDSGLGIALAAAIVLLWRRPPWWRLLPALALLALAYIAIGTFVFGAIRANRDHRLGPATAAVVKVTAAHTLWHTAYAGIGYLPNRYGMRFTDSVAYEYVKRTAPGTVFLSSRYETIVRKAYLGFIGAHPVEAARQYAAKLLVIVADTIPYLLIAALTLPAALLLSGERRLVRRLSLLSIPAIFVATVPVAMALPTETYEQGLYGAIGAIDVVGVCWAIKLLTAAASRHGGVRPLLASVHTPAGGFLHGRTAAWQVVRITAALVAALLILGYAGSLVRRDATRWQGTRPDVLMERV